MTDNPKNKRLSARKSGAMSLGEHFAKGAVHWNKFILSYEEDVFDFSNLILAGGRFDLDEYEFPLPVSFVDTVFRGSVHILNAHFDYWVDLTGAKFRKGLFIENSTCEGETIFESVRCEGSFMMSDCEFRARANFDDLDAFSRMRIADCVFSDDASFNEFGAYGGLIVSGVVFKKDTVFAGQFHREALFLSNKFEGFVDFNYAHFKAPLIFRGNEFKWRPAIDNIDLTYDPVMPEGNHHGPSTYHYTLRRLKIFGDAVPATVAKVLFIAKTDEQYPTLRQFRLFAKEYDDHRLALDIYALELKSRRLWYDPAFSSGFLIGLAYQILSDFGRCLVRPTAVLLGSFLAFSGVFYSMSTNAKCSGVDKISASALLSLNNTVPFAGWQKHTILTAAEVCLFGQNGPSLTYGIFSIVQVIISVILVFLLVLAIRNIVKMSQ